MLILNIHGKSRSTPLTSCLFLPTVHDNSFKEFVTSKKMNVYIIVRFHVKTDTSQREKRSTESRSVTTHFRVPTAPGKPGKMTTVFPVLEKY